MGGGITGDTKLWIRFPRRSSVFKLCASLSRGASISAAELSILEWHKFSSPISPCSRMACDRTATPFTPCKYTCTEDSMDWTTARTYAYTPSKQGHKQADRQIHIYPHTQHTNNKVSHTHTHTHTHTHMYTYGHTCTHVHKQADRYTPTNTTHEHKNCG